MINRINLNPFTFEQFTDQVKQKNFIAKIFK